MATIINDPYGPGRAGEAGENIKNQIAGSLQSIAQYKMRQISQRNQAQAYKGLGFPNDIATSLAMLPEEQQKLVLKQYGENQGFGGQQQLGMQMGQQVPGQQPLPQFRNKEERASYYKDLNETNKENRTYLKELHESAHEAKDNDQRLARLEKLTRSGSLRRPIVESALNTVAHGIWGVGIDLKPLFYNPSAEEFEKISKEMIKGAKSIFGSRITDQDLKTFMQMIPNATQSQEGKLRVIHQMKIFSEGIKVRKQAADYILRANGGKPPYNFKEMIEEIAGPKLNQLAQQYEDGLPQSSVPQTNSFNPLNAILSQG